MQEAAKAFVEQPAIEFERVARRAAGGQGIAGQQVEHRPAGRDEHLVLELHRVVEAKAPAPASAAPPAAEHRPHETAARAASPSAASARTRAAFGLLGQGAGQVQAPAQARTFLLGEGHRALIDGEQLAIRIPRHAAWKRGLYLGRQQGERRGHIAGAIAEPFHQEVGALQERQGPGRGKLDVALLFALQQRIAPADHAGQDGLAGAEVIDRHVERYGLRIAQL